MTPLPQNSGYTPSYKRTDILRSHHPQECEEALDEACNAALQIGRENRKLHE